MEKIKSTGNSLVLSEKISDSLINAIRRYVNEIPILAIDEVEIMKNDSPSYDETVAHRIGLVPLKMQKVKKDGEVNLKLSVNKEGIVYSGELKGETEVVFDKIPLTILDKDQEMELLAIARIGRGSEHAKFSPGLMFYRNKKEIKAGNKSKEVSEILESHGEKVKSESKTLILDINEACEEELRQAEVEVNDSDELVICLESFGQIPVEEIFPLAVKELKKDLEELSKKI